MAARGEQAGAVYVSIDADASPLLAKYQQAEAQSRAAGQRIAGALSSGFQQSTGIVDQFGRAVQGTIAPIEEATVATEALARANTHAVSEIQATSGALRVLESNGGLRAAERFIATTLGLGGALQAVFPIIGLVAVAEMLDKVISKFSKAHEQTEEFKSALKETEGAARSLVNTLDDINVDKMRDAFGGAAGERMRATVLEMQSFDKLTEAAGKRALIQAAGQDENWITKLFGKPTDIAAVKQEITTLSLQAQALAAQADAARNHANEVTGPREAAEAAKKRAAEQKREAAEAAEFEKRTQRAAVEGVAIAHREAAREKKELERDYKNEVMRGLEETTREYERDEENRIQAIRAEIAERNRADQEQIRARGVRVQSGDEIAILRAQQTYGLEIVHTRAEEINQAEQIVKLEEQMLSDRIASLQALKDYQTQNLLNREAERTDLEITRAQADLDKRRIQDQIHLQQLRQSPLGQQIRDIGQRIPGQLGGAITGGIFHGNIGATVGGAAKNVGQEVVGSLATAAIKELIVKIGLQTAATTILGAITGTHTAVVAANTVGTAVNTGATIGGTISTLANTVSTDLNTFWLAIKGILGFASGGRPPVGVPSVVGENGPELFVPDGPGLILPSVPRSFNGGMGASILSSSMVSNSSSRSISIGAIHAHGVSDVRQFAKMLPNVLKSVAPNFSPASR